MAVQPWPFDDFLQPAAGVSPADHLASGLVPLAALALAASAFSRVVPGVQALIALAVALTCLVVGLVEAGYHTATVGPYGDDYTGFLAGAAGLFQAGLAVRTLWRSRRSGHSRTHRYARRLGIGVLAILLLSEVGFPFVFGYVTTHVTSREVATPNLGAAPEDVTLTTSDGLTLEGWYVLSRNGAAVIVFPGRNGPQEYARMLVEHGYGALLFDRRDEGASEGDGNVFGWGGERDIHAAVDFLQKRPDVDPSRIGGMGFSVGGELMLHAAAEKADIAAVVPSSGPAVARSLHVRRHRPR